MALWFNTHELARIELQQAAEEGKDVAGLQGEYEDLWRALSERDRRALVEMQRQENLFNTVFRLRDDQRDAPFRALFEAIRAAPTRPDFDYIEPIDLAGIRDAAGAQPPLPAPQLGPESCFDRIYGAWLGRAAGCLLGKPVELWPRAGIRERLQEKGAYPLDGYLGFYDALPEGMARDDDIDYTIIGLYVLERYGRAFTSLDIGDAWLRLLPIMCTYTAERVAYMNLLEGYAPPETALRDNPYREWIGAQIRADMWGYVNPGNPRAAAEMAFADASLSHVKNGVYGAMWVAAMLAAAFATDDIEQILAAGLGEIPAQCRLAEAVRDTMRWAKTEPDWERTLDAIEAKYGRYHAIHTINNAALVTAGLMYGATDFTRGITVAVMGGWDTDCNGATVGSILGLRLGAGQLPDAWTRPLADTTRSAVMGFDHSRFHDLARRTVRFACDAKAGDGSDRG